MVKDKEGDKKIKKSDTSKNKKVKDKPQRKKSEWVGEVLKLKKDEKVSFKQALINASQRRKASKTIFTF
jgi:hypothetical protein